MTNDLQRKQMGDVHSIEQRLQSLRNKIPMSESQFNRELFEVIHTIIHVAEEYQTDDFASTAEQMIEESVDILLKEDHINE